jgi:D-beta-D-heptose 7-phosphate kinase/D-beta-D-heptose 1-phosphate adenosyltransferase
MNQIKSLEELLEIRKNLKAQNKKVVFTNGCFDIIHSGHIDYLNKAKLLGDVLIVGINSDLSVSNIKGNKRPILKESERALIVSNLKPVDYVTLFDDDTPAKLIEKLIPDILVKGGDWAIEKIVGREVVIANGGTVKSIEFVSNQSTSKIIQLILDEYLEK